MTTVARRQCEAMGAWRSGPAVFRRRFRITDGAGSKGVRGDDDPTTSRLIRKILEKASINISQHQLQMA